ncbi:MAG: hypothetical protein FJ042_00300 [Candidatus Cloacimonetes bacterium]|nr:hypothetical protein [Candidatus Cloacimonadota bacterium]
MKIEVSIGELVDKVSILEIKQENITNPAKLVNVNKEYALLVSDMQSLGITPLADEYQRLKAVNQRLWNIEDNIRILESKQDFGADFIALARNVYFENDTRAEIKKEINLRYGSELIEEKEYVQYK